MLEDLNKFREQAIDSFNRNYDPEDRCLPMEFKRLCTKFNINDTIEYKEYSMIIHGASSLNIYVPNQWIYIAAFFADYYLLLVKYKETVKSILKGYLDDRVKNCKDSEANATILLAAYNGLDKDYLIKFLYDYNWWGGAKTIDRADFYVSPILSAANLVNASQSYVADIAKNLAENPQALQLLKTDIAKISIQGTVNFKSASNTILYGPPGTGKTYAMQKIFTEYPEEHRTIVTFHQSYSYEEFIIGLKAKTEEGRIAYSYEKGVFYNACETAARLAGYSSLAECCADTKEGRNAKFAAVAEDKSRQFLFCIDEINRANISAVFGDLISLIEENKRLGAQNEMIVRLPYTQELFGVPANLRLLGTMNTADRSIQILDTALRRRFQFKEYLPDYDVLRNEKAKTVLQAINGRIRALLGQDRQIGHSYFFDIEASAADESIRILKALANKIIPLLQEYFYNDVEKIRFVLGEKDRTPDKQQSFYIEDESATAAFSNYDTDSEETQFYTLNTDGIASASMRNESASAFIDHITA